MKEQIVAKNRGRQYAFIFIKDNTKLFNNVVFIQESVYNTV